MKIKPLTKAVLFALAEMRMGPRARRRGLSFLWRTGFVLG